MEGDRRGHTCHQSRRAELGPAAPRRVQQTDGTWAKATLKALGVTPQHEKLGMESGEKLRG